MNDIVERIAERIDPVRAGALAITGGAGGVAFRDMGAVMEFAKMMAVADIGIPKHLRGNPGACLAVTVQAIEWGITPFQAANKSYSVNDRLGYESQLIHAVILARAPIRGRLKCEYSGDGPTRKCRVWAELRDGSGEVVSYESPVFAAIKVKNSPLWTGDPDQQFFYFSSRAFARRHFPDVLLGVYARDELEDSPALIEPPRTGRDRLAERLGAGKEAATSGFNAGFVKSEIAKTGEAFDQETGEILSAEDQAREQAEVDAKTRRLGSEPLAKEIAEHERLEALAAQIAKEASGIEHTARKSAEQAAAAEKARNAEADMKASAKPEPIKAEAPAAEKPPLELAKIAAEAGKVAFNAWLNAQRTDILDAIDDQIGALSKRARAADAERQQQQESAAAQPVANEASATGRQVDAQASKDPAPQQGRAKEPAAPTGAVGSDDSPFDLRAWEKRGAENYTRGMSRKLRPAELIKPTQESGDALLAYLRGFDAAKAAEAEAGR